MLDSQEEAGPEEIKSREVELVSESVTFLLRSLLNSSAADIVLVTLLRTAVETETVWYTSCYAVPRGHCLNVFVVPEAVHGLLGLPGRRARSRLHSFSPTSPLSLISHLASVDVKQNVH